MADPVDLEPLAARLEQSGDYRILRRVPPAMRYADDDPCAVKRLGLIVDIETTGLDPASDRIIELGVPAIPLLLGRRALRRPARLCRLRGPWPAAP